MKRLAFWLLPFTLIAGSARYARLGDFEGSVLIQLQAADDWLPARRNLPLRESAWVRTESSSRVEIELDDGNVVRLGPETLIELSDYTRLSNGQSITQISLDHGLAYFTGAAAGSDSMVIAVPGAQVTVHQNTRLRLEARDPWSLIAAADGAVRFASPNAEFDLNAGQIVKLDPNRPGRFFLNREIPPLETDRWSDERDQVLGSSTSAGHLPALHYGLADLDTDGTWAQSRDFGYVWKPKVSPGWTPFHNGRWLWYDGLGYTWIGDDPWGWLPYHYGRWLQLQNTSWVWAPGDSAVFKPGEVYWIESDKLFGWGALAPGEDWKPTAQPRQYLKGNIAYAAHTPGSYEIDPAGFTPSRQDLQAPTAFAVALSSPPFPASRLDAYRPPLRVRSVRAAAIANDGAVENAPANPAPARLPSPSSDQAYSGPPPAPPRAADDAPAEFDAIVPVYTGIIVVRPPKSKEEKNPPAKTAPPPREHPKPKHPDSEKSAQ